MLTHPHRPPHAGLDEFSDDNPALLTVCGHTFHLQCVVQWSARSVECPLCLKRLRMAEPLAQELLGTGREEAVVRPLQPSGPTVPETEAELVRMLQTLALEARFNRIRQREVQRGGGRGAPPPHAREARHGPPTEGAAATSSSARRAERERERERVTRDVQALLYHQQHPQGAERTPAPGPSSRTPPQDRTPPSEPRESIVRFVYFQFRHERVAMSVHRLSSTSTLSLAHAQGESSRVLHGSHSLPTARRVVGGGRGGHSRRRSALVSTRWVHVL